MRYVVNYKDPRRPHATFICGRPYEMGYGMVTFIDVAQPTVGPVGPVEVVIFTDIISDIATYTE